MQTTRYFGLVAKLCVTFCLLIGTAWSQNGGNAEKEKPPERLIYMPFKNLKAVFEKPDGSVLVPYADYIKLWEKAFGDGMRKPDHPPVSGVITSASYSAKVEKDIAQISATLVVQVLEKGWAEIPVKFGEAAIGKLTSDTGKVLLRGTGNGTYSLLLPTAGEHRISLELTARVRTAPDGKSLELDVPAVGITDFELLVPEADQSMELKPKLTTQPVEVAAKESKIKATIGSTEKISVRWHPRVGTKPDMELLASVTNHTLVTVEDGLIHTDAWLTYEILRGQLEKFKFAVPKGHRILDITSDAKIKEWKAVDEDNRQVVTVELLSRADGKVQLGVHTERATPVEAFDVAGQDGTTAFGMHAIDVIRESGQIAVKSGNELTLTVEEQRGLLRVAEGDVDSKIRRPGAVYYNYYNPMLRLKLLSKPVEPRLIVDHASQLVFRDDQLRLRSVLNYTIDRAGVFELKFKLPDDLTIENVICDNMKQFFVSPDKTWLTVSLREKTLGTLPLMVTSIRTLDPTAEKTDQVLPLLEPLGTELENGKVQIYAPEAIEVNTDDEKLVSVQRDPAPQPEVVANARLVSSWLFNRRPIEIPVRTVRKSTRLTAIVGTRANVKQGQVQVTTRLTYIIEYAGIDTFRFLAPEAVADRLQITSTSDGSSLPIKKSPPVDGWVTCTVVTPRDVLGTQQFEIKYDIVPTAGEGANKESAAIEVIQAIDPYDKSDGPQGKRDIRLSRTIGEMTVLKDRALSVSATASGGDVEPIDVRELQNIAQDGFVAYRYFKQPVKLELASSKYDIQGVIETVVSKALVEMVLDRAGVGIYRCRYVLKSSERQRLRIDLPENVDVLGVFVDRKQTALEKADLKGDKGWTSYFISVARTKSSDEPFTLSLVFRHSFNPAPFAEAGGRLLARLPVIGGDGNVGVAVQQLYTKIWVPPEYSLIGTPTIKEGNRIQQNFSVQTKTRLRESILGRTSSTFGEQNLDEWIGHDTGGIFDFPTEGKWFQFMNLGGSKQIEVGWWHLPFYTWIVSGALVLIALILRNTSWDNKLTLLVLALFASCAYALKDHDLILNGLQVASYGLAALVAIWLIHGLLSLKPSLISTVEPPPTTLPPDDPTAAVANPS